MMILPLADALMNCLQNLTSRIAGMDNEMMTGRVMGMGAMLGFGLGAIKEQFRTPSSNIKSGDSNNENSGGGLQGFVNRAKSVINPSINLSSEQDYNGNINPVRTALPKQSNNISITTSSTRNSTNMQNENKNTVKTVAGKIARTGLSGVKSYVSIGARMAEGDFDKSPYKINQKNRKNKFQSTEYINKVNEIKKLGDENEPKK